MGCRLFSSVQSQDVNVVKEKSKKVIHVYVASLSGGDAELLPGCH